MKVKLTLKLATVEMDDTTILDMVMSGKAKGSIEEEIVALFPQGAQSINKPNPPKEEKWFKVNPSAIHWAQFLVPRKDKNQEDLRKQILHGLEENLAKQERWRRGELSTMFQKNTWSSKSYLFDKTASELDMIAKKSGYPLADHIVQRLEWAQRIDNGEDWDTLCNNDDSLYYPRLVKWGHCLKLVGGKRNGPPTYVRDFYGKTDAVPLLVKYE